jgi:hypothetical protein
MTRHELKNVFEREKDSQVNNWVFEFSFFGRIKNCPSRWSLLKQSPPLE